MTMPIDRRAFLRGAAGVAGTVLLSGRAARAAGPLDRSTPPRLKTSCCAYSYRKFLAGRGRTMSLEQLIERAAGMSLDGVELTSYYFDQATPDYDHHLRRLCFLAGLDVSGTALGNSFAVAAGPERDKQLASVRQWIDRAVELGAPCLRVFGGGVPKGSTKEQGIVWAVESLKEAAPHAEQRGIYLALENHGGVTERPEDLVAILKGVESEWVGANLDTGNFRGEDPYTDMALVAPYAVNVHFKASVSPRGKPAQPADYGRVVRLLREARYSGYLALEYESAEDPMTAVPRIVGELRGAIRAAEEGGAA
jgi:sugar phosphate isomerase/epimerase